MKKNKMCECGCGREAQMEWCEILDDDGQKYGTIYKLCMNCVHDFGNYNLSPKQFKALLKNGHENWEFMLHDDFYDDDGNAIQPAN